MMRISQAYVVDDDANCNPIIELRAWETRSVKYGRRRAQGHVTFRRGEQYWHGRVDSGGYVTKAAPYTDQRKIRELDKKWLCSASIPCKVETLNRDEQGATK